VPPQSHPRAYFGVIGDVIILGCRCDVWSVLGEVAVLVYERLLVWLLVWLLEQLLVLLSE